MKKAILFIFLVSAKLTSGQIINGDFEVWDTTYSAAYGSSLVSLFGVHNPKAGTVNPWVLSSPFGAAQTTDSYSGNYSLILHNWYNYAKEWMTYHQPLNSRPQSLNGYFKYITGGVNGLAHGKANVTLTRFNGITNDTIASGSFRFDSTVSYTPFQITLNYVSSSNPDSITIYMINSDRNVYQEVVGHLLYLDNLTLNNSTSGTKNLNGGPDLIAVFPNPAVNELHIQNNATQSLHFSFFNSLGERIIDETLTDKMNTIDLSTCSKGIYFFRVTSSEGYIIKTGKIIKE